jgi:hypothetical protein
MRRILCTFCHEPIVGEPVDAGEASFCSERCQLADVARQLALAPPAEIRVLVAVCHNGPVVDRKVAQNFIAMGWGNRIPRVKEELGITEIASAWFTQMPRVDALRNVALEQAIRDGFSHVLFLDADMLHPDDLFARILKYCRREILVSGFYTQRAHPYAPIALRDGELHASGRYFTYRYDADYTQVDADGLRAEDVVGMGCALIPLSIVKALGPRPWFEYRDDEHGWPMVSEDVPFCERVRAAGFGIYLDPSIKCGHLYTEFATEQHWQRAQAVMAHTQEQLAQHMTITAEPDPVVQGAP